MKINYNVSALIANNSLKNADNRLTDSLQRLSTGLKIPNAKDDPAGLAISRRMNAQLTGLESAKDNSGDGISVVQTADGVLAEVTDILQRMNELAIQAANGTLSQSDREAIQEEVSQLKDEISRIAEVTQFNGQSLLDGTFDLRGYATVDDGSGAGFVTDPDVTVNTYSDKVPAGTLTIRGLSVSYDSDTNTLMEVALNPPPTVTDYEGNTYTMKAYPLLDDSGNPVTDSAGNELGKPAAGEDLLTFYNDKGMEFQLKIDRNLDNANIDLEITAKGAMTMQVGANENQTLDIRMPKLTLSALGISNLDVTTTYGDDESGEKARIQAHIDNATTADEKALWERQMKALEAEAFRNVFSIEQEGYYDGKTKQERDTEQVQENLDQGSPTTPHIGADRAIEALKGAINYVNSMRANLGAYQNRLEHTVSNIEVTHENMTAAYSRIMDVDMADEMTTYTTQQVLSQAGTSMLAQANERPSQVLQLLQ